MYTTCRSGRAEGIAREEYESAFEKLKRFVAAIYHPRGGTARIYHRDRHAAHARSPPHRAIVTVTDQCSTGLNVGRGLKPPRFVPIPYTK